MNSCAGEAFCQLTDFRINKKVVGATDPIAFSDSNKLGN